MPAHLDDLRPLAQLDGPFLTLLLPAPSRHADAQDRFEIEQKNALKAITDRWPDDDMDAVAELLSTMPHDAGAAAIVVRAADGTTVTEFVDDPVEPAAFVGEHARLAPLIESRQRTIAHVVVETDKAGADLTAFDGGDVLATDVVEGDTEHIHRGHPGGWSQRRFQQRAENTWEENAGEVAAAATRLAADVDARLIAVAGPERAKTMVVGELEDAHADVHAVEAGDADGIADEVVRLTSTVAAADAKAMIERATESMATADEFDGDIVAALETGRVEVLLVHDDGRSSADNAHVDRCVQLALTHGSHVHVVPRVAALDDGVAAVLRW